MGYKTELQNNNVKLQEILDLIEDMPEGGGGFAFSSSAGGVPGNDISAVSVLDFTDIVFTSSAEQGEV